ncbi:hypothetical protein MMC22_008515, partial [Lobaria immixta]|nr:hypothetical protein [Lobaria immixta]
MDGGTTTLAAVWDTMEAQFAVIISCLPTYRSLFITVRKREAKRYKEMAFDIHDKAGRSPPCHSFRQSVHGSPSQQDLA